MAFGNWPFLFCFYENDGKWAFYISIVIKVILTSKGGIIMAVSHRGAISFGLVHIPVGLYTATQDNDISFRQLCKEDNSRVKYKRPALAAAKK